MGVRAPSADPPVPPSASLASPVSPAAVLPSPDPSDAPAPAPVCADGLGCVAGATAGEATPADWTAVTRIVTTRAAPTSTTAAPMPTRSRMRTR